MIYKFEQFNAEIVDPTIDVQYAGFDLKTGRTDVNIVLTSGGTKFGLTLSDNSQPSEWSPEAVSVWVQQQLEKFKV